MFPLLSDARGADSRLINRFYFKGFSPYFAFILALPSNQCKEFVAVLFVLFYKNARVAVNMAVNVISSLGFIYHASFFCASAPW